MVEPSTVTSSRFTTRLPRKAPRRTGGSEAYPMTGEKLELQWPSREGGSGSSSSRSKPTPPHLCGPSRQLRQDVLIQRIGAHDGHGDRPFLARMWHLAVGPLRVQGPWDLLLRTPKGGPGAGGLQTPSGGVRALALFRRPALRPWTEANAYLCFLDDRVPAEQPPGSPRSQPVARGPEAVVPLRQGNADLATRPCQARPRQARLGQPI